MCKKCYLSGKVRGLSDEAVRANFADAEKQVRSLGYEVVNPLDIVAEMEEETRMDERRVMMALLIELSHCEAIWMVDGWREGSEGAACEYHFARGTGIKVLNDEGNAMGETRGGGKTAACGEGKTDDDGKTDEANLLDQLLSQRYHATGETEDMMLKTSVEIAYEVEDMCNASPSDVAAWLFSHGFRTKVVGDVNTWIVFELMD